LRFELESAIYQIETFVKIKKLFIGLCVIFATVTGAQSYRQECDAGINFLRQDLISLLRKTPAMPPLAEVYLAAKGRFDQIESMRNQGDFLGCANEAARVLQITKPYGNR
jgi:hypothetical protein